MVIRTVKNYHTKTGYMYYECPTTGYCGPKHYFNLQRYSVRGIIQKCVYDQDRYEKNVLKLERKIIEHPYNFDFLN